MTEEAVTAQTQTSDNAQGEIVPQPQSPPPEGATGGSERAQPQSPPPEGATGGSEEAPQAAREAPRVLIEAEHAMTTIRAKASALHTLLSNVGHFATIPVVDVQMLIAEINHLLGIIRAKL